MERKASILDSEFLTTRQIAEAFNRSHATIQRWCREGRIPAARIEGTYLIRKSDFDEWFDSKSVRENVVLEDSKRGK